jgi:hypothetical protein
MKCFQHADADAAALCPQCQKGLCHACASQFAPMSCEACFAGYNRRVVVHHAGRLFLTAAVFASGAAFFASQPHPDRAFPAMMGAAFVSMLWGWITITEHSSRGSTIVATPGMWLLFAMIKLLFSGFVGLVAAPVGIVNAIVQIVRVVRARRALRPADTGSAMPRDLAPANTPVTGI